MTNFDSGLNKLDNDVSEMLYRVCEKLEEKHGTLGGPTTTYWYLVQAINEHRVDLRKSSG